MDLGFQIIIQWVLSITLSVLGVQCNNHLQKNQLGHLIKNSHSWSPPQIYWIRISGGLRIGICAGNKFHRWFFLTKFESLCTYTSFLIKSFDKVEYLKIHLLLNFHPWWLVFLIQEIITEVPMHLPHLKEKRKVLLTSV